MIDTRWLRLVRPLVQTVPCPRVRRARLRRRFSPLEVGILEDRCVPTVTLGTNFAGLDFPGSGQFIPPETQLAAGPNHLVEAVNTQIAIYNKAGTLLSSLPLTAFFNSGSPAPVEPVVLYDELANRFVVAALQRNLTTQTSVFHLAVSNSADPTAGFTEKQVMNVQQIAGAQTAVADFPRIGWNADAYVVTFNMFTIFGGVSTYAHTQVLTVAKSSVLDANPSTFTRVQVNRFNQFGFLPAAMHGSQTGEPLWFVRSGGGNSNGLQVTQMSNVLSATPTFTDFIVGVPTYGSPPAATQQGSSALLGTGDTRMLSAAVRGNRLVASHNVGTSGVAHARWYEFSVSGAPTLTQSGEINPGAGVHTYYPSIEIAANGDLGMTYVESSATEFLSMYVTGRTNTDPLGTMQTPVLVRAGQAGYSDFTGVTPFATGDNRGISVDPVTGTSFWAANEFATNAATNNWGTWITNFNLGTGSGGPGAPNSISGQKFHDVNGNTIRDAGEAGLPGWIIFLDTNNNGSVDSGESTAITDASGNYSFNNLAVGLYRVREVLQAGWVRTTANPADIVLSSGGSAVGVNFGNFQQITISGTVFNDLNNNTIRDATEPGLQGWTLFLDANNNGTLDAGESTAVSDASGNFSFPGQGPGTFRVRQVVQSGFTRTTTNPADIVASSGTNVSNILFGNSSTATVAGTISGQVFHDVNGNAIQDAGEGGQSNLIVFLDNNNNGTPDVGETTVITDSNGNYSFTNLANGIYRVRQFTPTGFVRTTANPGDIVLVGGSVTGVNFGNFQLISISGLVFHDLNGNASRDPGEPGLAGWTVFLDTNNNGAFDTGEPSNVSAADGGYGFSGLGPGTYRVREVVQSGFTRTTQNPPDILASSGTNVTGINFGNVAGQPVPANSISGVAFLDVNGNAIRDAGEPGQAGWIIFLDNNNNGSLDGGESLAVTDSNGNYSFTNLAVGVYRVRELTQAGFVRTTANPADIVLVGTGVSGVNFGNFQQISISGTAFNDLNNNTIRDGGEPGLAGWTIFLDTNNSGTLDAGETSTITDASGNFSFLNQGPGTFRVREVVQSGFTRTTQNPPDIVASSGTNVTGILFGNVVGQPAPANSISGQVFLDVNGNGFRDFGEPGQAGVIVFLDNNNNGNLDAGEALAVTDSNGNFSFTNLAAGVFRVRQLTQAGFVRTTANPADIVFLGGSVSGVTFGIFQQVSISGRAFNDLNNNANQDAGEPGLAGVTIFLDTNNNGVFDFGETSTLTDASGNFSFVGVGPGTIRVREVVPSGFTRTTQNPSDIVTTSGTNVTGLFFGNIAGQPAPANSISGQVFLDVNGNAIRDAGEPGQAGVIVFLDNNNNGNLDAGEALAVTDSNGNFSFTNLAVGVFRVRQLTQAGFVRTTPLPADIFLVGGGVSGVNFGIFQQVSISGRAFNDLNNNANQDAGEPGLAGVTIFLDTNNNGVFDFGETSTVTDASGNFSFVGVGPGTIRVREVVPSGFTRTTQNPSDIVTSSGTNIVGVLFGNIGGQPAPTNSISGLVFHDVNGNGFRDFGEGGQSGWIIFLDTNNNGNLDAGESLTVTDFNGNYSFTNLATGVYRVRELTQAGFVRTTPNPADIFLVGGSVSGVNFGNFRQISISGTVFNDLNNNTIRDGGEPGLAGWTVFLDANNSGTLDAGETSTLTDASGNFSFLNQGPGTFRVREVLMSGFTRTTVNPADIVASSGTNVANVLFGNIGGQPAPANSISGLAFHDINGNGFRDAGEPGQSGWIIFLDNNNNGNLDAGESLTVTDSNGNYSFTNLAVGVYRVREVPPAGWVRTTPNPADIVLVGGAVTGVNFGNFQLIVISGQVFNDLNRNASRDTNEPGLAGWTVFLDTNNNGTFDGGETGTLTDANGNFSFVNVGPGTHRVREVVQGGFTRITANPADIVASSGTNVAGILFGNATTVSGNSISGQKFHDLNGNGRIDLREPGLPGWTIFIDANNNDLLDAGETSTITDSIGNFTFGNLADGTYRVREVQQNGWVRTTANPVPIVITTPRNVHSVIFGNLQLISISGRVFNDGNGNQVQDAGEPGLVGWTIFLDLNNNGLRDPTDSSVLSDSNGNFTFTNLRPGTYRVRQVVQPGFTRTTNLPPDIVATSGTHVPNVLFGNTTSLPAPAPSGTISGVVFNDVNGNQVREAAEPSLAGFTIFLDTNSNGTLDVGEARTITNGNGNFSFANLGPGTYRVREVLPAGWTQTTLPPADIALTSGGSVTGVTFGNFQLITISGQAFNDLNGNGIRDTGEGGVAGSTIFLDTNNNAVLDAGEASTTTDANGNFSFAGVGPGTFRVRAVLQAGRRQTTANPADIAAISGTNVTTVTFGSKAVLFNYDFGMATSPVAAGFTQVTEATTYNLTRGFGWLSGTIQSNDHPSEPDPLKRDINFTTEGVFAVDVASGIYDVKVTLGSAGFAHEQMGVFLEGIQVDSVDQGAGVFVVRTYRVTVRDGQLTLGLRDLGGPEPFAVINGLELAVAAPPAERRFDFGTATSPVATGFTQVTEATTYSSARGFGWLSGTILSNDHPSEADPLKRDLNYSSQGVFVVDVTNGTYDVKLTIGSAAFAHDLMGVFLEGSQVDTVNTAIGVFAVRTYRVNVNDGQLTLELRDLGGDEPFAVINGLETARVAGSSALGVTAGTNEESTLGDPTPLLQSARALSAANLGGGSAEDAGQPQNVSSSGDLGASVQPMGDLDPTLVDRVFASRSRRPQDDPLADSSNDVALFDNDLEVLLAS